MTQIVRQQTDSTRNIPASILKGAAANLAIQALGKNLNKKNFMPTLAFGALGGIIGDYVDSKIPNSYGLAGGALSGLTLGLTNSLINGDDVPKTMFKYVLLGTLINGSLNIAKANAKPTQQIRGYIDPEGILNKRGIKLAHSHYIILEKSSYGENGKMQRQLSTGFQYPIVVKALELAKKTKSVQNALKLFEDKKNSLLFMETDLEGYGYYGNIDGGMNNGNGICDFTSRNNRGFLSKKSDYYFDVRVELFPLNTKNLSNKAQIATMAVTIGHELFVHSAHIEAVELWKNGQYSEAIGKEMIDRGFEGNIDHRLYMQGKKPKMTQYLKELKSVAQTAGYGLTASDIQSAINSHDKTYKYLLNQ